MSKLVLLHKNSSEYEDEPDKRYEFSSKRNPSYLSRARQAVGDWIVYYEPGKGKGARRYFAVAKVAGVEAVPGKADYYCIAIEPESYLEFDKDVPREVKGRPFESELAGPDGLILKHGGSRTASVRGLPEREFAEIVNFGLPVDLEDIEARRYAPRHEVDDPARPFERPILERLTRRAYRDVAFRRKVRAAYDERCSISGLGLRNGGGRPEVQAAHIRPVEENGSDSVRNGLALSATLHWMFDRGLIALDVPDPADPGDVRILVSDNKVPREVADRLIRADRRLTLPHDRRDWPHPANIQWHRENRFGMGDPSGLFPN